MLKGFKDFILRGNVLDLAVAVVIGAAFTALVAVFGEALINPVIASLGGADVAGLGFTIVEGNDATFVDIGAIITAAIIFVITAAVVYFVFVAPMNALAERRKAKLGAGEDEPEVPVDVALLTEIRDLLQQQRGTTSSEG